MESIKNPVVYYKCPILNCNKHSPRAYSLKKHVLDHFTDGVCPVCRKSVKSPKAHIMKEGHDPAHQVVYGLFANHSTIRHSRIGNFEKIEQQHREARAKAIAIMRVMNNESTG